jgi:hypothetical protein
MRPYNPTPPAHNPGRPALLCFPPIIAAVLAPNNQQQAAPVPCAALRYRKGLCPRLVLLVLGAAAAATATAGRLRH